MPENSLLVVCSCPDLAVAEKISNHLVDQHLAACVNITSEVTSVYLWQGERESAQERLLLIKTTKAGYPGVESAIQSLHPYELPEIIAVPLERGERQYLSWIHQCIHPAP